MIGRRPLARSRVPRFACPPCQMTTKPRRRGEERDEVVEGYNGEAGKTPITLGFPICPTETRGRESSFTIMSRCYG